MLNLHGDTKSCILLECGPLRSILNKEMGLLRKSLPFQC